MQGCSPQVKDKHVGVFIDTVLRHKHFTLMWHKHVLQGATTAPLNST